MKFLLIILMLNVTALFATSDDSDKHWEEYKKLHRKNYASHEEPLRKELFLKHKAFVDQHNEKYAKGQVPYWIGVNQFSDMVI